jgi:aminopeptidase 2
MLRIILRLMIGGFSTKDQIEQVGAFFSTQDTGQYGQVLAQEIEKVEARCTWVTRDTKDVESWLQKHGYLN